MIREALVKAYPKVYQLGALLLCLSLMNGCVATAIVGGAAVGSAIYDKRSVKTHANDVLLASQIDARLIAEKNMPSRGVSIEVIEGEVILTGYLPSQEHIHRAVYICERQKNVKKVRNELQVGKSSFKKYLSDSKITSAVKAKLLKDGFVDGFSIHVETVHGKVYLQGVIDDVEQAYRAKHIARKTKGVTAVVNLLRVKKKQ